MKEIVVYGAGGYGREICCLINKINKYNPRWKFCGFLDDNEKLWGTDTPYGKILGGLDWLNTRTEPIDVVLAIANSTILKKIVGNVANEMVDFPNLIDPEVSFLDEDTFKIGKGNIIGYGCRFSCNVKLGDFNILVNASVFGHDVSVGNYNLFFPEVRLSGMVSVGDSNFFGMRSAVIQGFEVGSNTRIAAGSFVMRNTKDGFLYSGNPAKIMRL